MSVKLIMDNGASSIKCGIAGDEDPKMYFIRKYLLVIYLIQLHMSQRRYFILLQMK